MNIFRPLRPLASLSCVGADGLPGSGTQSYASASAASVGVASSAALQPPVLPDVARQLAETGLDPDRRPGLPKYSIVSSGRIVTLQAIISRCTPDASEPRRVDTKPVTTDASLPVWGTRQGIGLSHRGDLGPDAPGYDLPPRRSREEL